MSFETICTATDESGDQIGQLVKDPEFLNYFNSNAKQCVHWFGHHSDPHFKSLNQLIIGNSTSAQVIEQAVQGLMELIEESDQSNQVNKSGSEEDSSQLDRKTIIGLIARWIDNADFNTQIRIIRATVPFLIGQDTHSHAAVVLIKIIQKNCGDSHKDDKIRQTMQDIFGGLIAEHGDKSKDKDGRENKEKVSPSLSSSSLRIQCMFSLLSLLFHIDQQLAQSMFLLDCVQSIKLRQDLLSSSAVIFAAMDALSSACISQECRGLVAKNFGTVVEQVFANAKDDATRLLAASIVVKTGVGTTNAAQDEQKQQELRANLDQVSQVFEEVLRNEDGKHKYDEKSITVAIESLAYTSLMQSVKKRLNDLKVLAAIVKRVDVTSTSAPSPTVALQEPASTAAPASSFLSPSSSTYCALTVLANITQYTPKRSEQEQKIEEIQKYAGKRQLHEHDEDDVIVDKRCKSVLDTGVVTIISKSCPRYTSTSKAVVGLLLRNLAMQQRHRATLVAQGGLAVLMYLLLPDDEQKSKPSVDLRTTTSALAKTLISTNPNVAFSSKLSPVTAIKPLIKQLDLATDPDARNLPLLDTFEALMALTNLASYDEQCRSQILTNGWTKVENVLTACSNTMVQRACLELICNLTVSPLCAEKFLDVNSMPSLSRLELLSAFMTSDDRLTATAASGAMAMLSEYQVAGQAISSSKISVIDRLVKALNNEDSDILLRVLVTLNNISPAIVEKISEDGKRRLKELSKNEDEEIADMAKQLVEEHER